MSAPETRPAKKGLPNILMAGDRRLRAFVGDEDDAAGPLLVLGWREWVSLPEFGIARIAAKLDTGARTSALHADRIDFVEQDGAAFVRFHIAGEQGEGAGSDDDGARDGRLPHEAPLLGRRTVRSSNGESERRAVIATGLVLGGRTLLIELTLTNRAGMDLPMLIGRAALAGHALVDPDRSFCSERPDLSRLRRVKGRGSRGGGR